LSLSFIIIGITPLAPSWVMRLSLTVHVHTTKHCRFYRGQQLGHVHTLDWSRTHNKTLQVLQRTTIESWWLLSTVHVHTTKHRRFYRGQQLSHVPH